MGYMIRQIAESAKFVDEVRLQALEAAIPYETLQAVVQDHQLQRQRKRKLSAEMGLLLVICMNLFSSLSLTQVLYKMVQGLRYIWPDPHLRPASKGAISQLRYQQGARPIVDLFQRVCKPMATPQTKGAFLGPWRLMGIDGTTECLADTPTILHAFGRHSSGLNREAAFPQGQVVCLVEIGTHAIVDAGLWPVHTSERLGAKRMLRSVTDDMLVLWDAGLHSFAMIQATLARRAHFLGAAPIAIRPQRLRRLPDGSWLVKLVENPKKHKSSNPPLRLRLIEYTFSDPALPGYNEKRRLFTSLLDEQAYPALLLAQSYHERWEVEIVIDEADTHQRQPSQVFRSRHPVGLLQEFYGLLIAHYAIRKIMLDSAHLAGLDSDQISFTNALRIIQNAIAEFQQTHLDQIPDLYQRLLKDIAVFRLPPRENRINPRVINRQVSRFDKKHPKHRCWPQPTVPVHDAIVLI
jgi:hypothetical protein